MVLTLTILHIVVCFFLVLVVLLQTGKGADMGAAFGGSSQAVFGAAGAASGLKKITTVAAIIFMVTSIGLTIINKHRYEGSVLEQYQEPSTTTPESTAPLPGSGSQNGTPTESAPSK